MKVLITGSSGSGKTYLTKYFQGQGLNAIDADTVYRLGEYYNDSQRVDFPVDADKNFFDNHEFLWDKAILQKLLAENEDIFLLGLAGNIFECLSYFDKVFYLDIPPEEINRRMHHPSRENPMGKSKEQRDATIEWVENELKPKASEHGLIFLDGTQKPALILQQIQQLV